MFMSSSTSLFWFRLVFQAKIIFITGSRKGKTEKVNSQFLSRSPNGILLSYFGKKLNTLQHLAVSEATNCSLLAAALPPQMKLGVLLQQRKGKIILM